MIQRALPEVFSKNPPLGERGQTLSYINMKLAAMGLAPCSGQDGGLLELTGPILDSYLEKSRLLSHHLCPADQRIQNFLDGQLAGLSLNGPIRLPALTFILDRHGLARELSLPVAGDSFSNELLSSYRVAQGVLHNPRSDRRTTVGTFHIAEGGWLVPNDKVAVPRLVFGNLLSAALNPPLELLRLPFTADAREPAEAFVSLLLRPIVGPEVPGFSSEKTLELRFFAPGGLVSNLDFVESIFGNAGDPYLPENDAGLDIEHWTGHSGCVILAPHLTKLTKKELGLPAFDEAGERQRRHGMCWRHPDELYNDGNPFKICLRTLDGVMVTLIADNYFGYCKKEVKTQISFSANLYGIVEEEHAGGALAFASYHLGYQFQHQTELKEHTFDDVRERYGSMMEFRPEGYGVDRLYNDILYVPEESSFDLFSQKVSWTRDGSPRSIPLQPGRTYIFPTGYKVCMAKHPTAPSWRLIGTEAEGAFCHKPATVSGGGKSEISKPFSQSLITGPFYISDFKRDMELAESIIRRNYAGRYRPEVRRPKPGPSRPLLSPRRSLGSVIKLLTPSPEEFTDAYNAVIADIPHHVRSLVFIIKRFYRPEWGDDWKSHFTVDIVNDAEGHELKFDGRHLVAEYTRVGFEPGGSWRTYKLRQSFIEADKVQMEDDISASIVVPARKIPHLPAARPAPSYKVVSNCEARLFQRPDEAIVKGYDLQTEADFGRQDVFFSNYEPLRPEDARRMLEETVEFEKFSAPVKALIRAAARREAGYFVCTSMPRVIDGKPSRNPRYLQERPDIANARSGYVAETGARLRRKVPAGSPVIFPVSSVLCGHRNNPPEPGCRNLAVYNPIHYLDLPELFMDFIASLTGRSPSTTGAGSEGALTKGPFNALPATADLNNALVSFILTGLHGFFTSAGHVGPHFRVDHDISLLIPEIWSRLTPEEREPQWLIAHGYLEPLQDFQHHGALVQASRLGYRITSRFTHEFFGRIFDTPDKVLNKAMLQPETQDLGAFVDGVNNIVASQRRAAQGYFEDGTVELAAPPLQALLRIMVDGSYKDRDVRHPEIRKLFTLDYLLASDWYRERLLTKQQRDIELWQRHVATLRAFINKPHYSRLTQHMDMRGRLAAAERRLKEVSAPEYLDDLKGTLGADPLAPAGVTSPS